MAVCMVMKRISVLIIALITGYNLYGQYTDTAYIYTYGGIQNDVCNQIRATPDGGYILIGTSNSFGCGNTDFYAVKIDSVGRHEWSRSYGGTENEEGFSVAPTFDKGYAFIGFTDSYGAGGYDVYLVKTDSMGNFQWQRTYGGADWDFGYSIRQLSDSGFIICGLTYSYGGGNGNMYVIRTDKNGSALWAEAVEDTNYYSYYSVGNAICVEKDSLFAITGNFCAGSDTSAYFILMNNKGTVEKTKIYGVNHNYFGNSINVTSDNGFITFGATDSIMSGKPDEMLLKLDSVGNMQWMQVYGSSGYSIGHDVIQIPNKTYIAVSTSNAYGWGGFAMRIWQMDSYGNPLCGPSYGGTGDEQGNSIALSKNGNVLFAGATNSTDYTVGLDDAYVVRLTKDSIFNIVNYYAFPYYQYKDTTMCTLGVESQSLIPPEVKIFPNPVSFSATIIVQGTIGEKYLCSIYNEMGDCVVQNIPLISTSHDQLMGQFEKGNFSAGIYFCRIINPSGSIVVTSKIVVE